MTTLYIEKYDPIKLHGSPQECLCQIICKMTNRVLAYGLGFGKNYVEAKLYAYRSALNGFAKKYPDERHHIEQQFLEKFIKDDDGDWRLDGELRYMGDTDDKGDE